MRLIIFDCDGTLVDSQHVIAAAMSAAFGAHGFDAPPTEIVRTVVGLSLSNAIATLLPEADEAQLQRLCETYRTAHFDLRSTSDHHEPLFDGAGEVVHALAAHDDVLLAIATGKARRGLVSVLERHGLLHLFATLQTADDAPSKPHPGMIEQAMEETGAAPRDTLMIGDTTFDMLMAKNAGTGALGVAWGYHPPQDLTGAGADQIAETFNDVLAAAHRLGTNLETAE